MASLRKERTQVMLLTIELSYGSTIYSLKQSMLPVRRSPQFHAPPAKYTLLLLRQISCWAWEGRPPHQARTACLHSPCPAPSACRCVMTGVTFWL